LNGEPYCGTCPFWSFIKTPIQLGVATPRTQAMIAAAKIIKEVRTNPAVLFEDPSLEAFSFLEKKERPT